MARKKVKLAYIVKRSMRKATLNKRKKWLIKKINELSVLCGIEACGMIYSPMDSNPEVWPSNSGAEKVVKKFEMLSETEQEKRMVNHEGFLRQSLSKFVVKNKKRMKDNSEKMMKETMFHLLGVEGEKINLTDGNREDLCKYIYQYLKELYHHRNEILNQSHLEYEGSSSTAATITTTNIAEVFNSSRVTNDLSAVMTPVISLNHIPQQIVSQEEEWLASERMDEQMSFPRMDDDDNNRYNHQQF